MVAARTHRPILRTFWQTGWLGLGLLVLVWSVSQFVIHFPGRHNFGRYGMVHPVILPSGLHPDGTGTDPITRALVNADCFEEVELAVLVVFAFIAFRVHRMHSRAAQRYRIAEAQIEALLAEREQRRRQTGAGVRPGQN